jgi:hypothetical protein
MRLALALTLLGAVGCTDRAIEVRLHLPGEPAPPAAFDYSCIGSVDVLPIGAEPPASYDIGILATSGTAVPCIDLPAAPTSLADFAAELHGRLDIPVPPGGLQAIELRARTGHCSDDPYREAILYGGGVYDGSSGQLTVDVQHNISCSTASPYTVRPIDVFALVDSQACPPAAPGIVFAGDIRPTALDAPGLPDHILEGGVGEADLTAAITAPQVASYGATYHDTCAYIGYNNNDDLSGGMTCFTPGAPTVCSDPGTVEVPVIPYTYWFNSADAAATMVGGAADPPVFGIVLENKPDGSKAPAEGATITVDAGDDAAVVYGDRGDPAAQTFAPVAGATQTTASGTFMVFPRGVVGLTVSAPGYTSQKIYAGSGDEQTVTVMVVLDPAS